MSVEATFDLKLDIDETPDIGGDLVSSDPKISPRTTLGSSRGTLNSSSTPVVSAQYSKRYTLSAGAVTIDLTSLAEAAFGGTVTKDLTGLKIHAFKIAAHQDNTDELVFKKGATNGYPLFGEVGANVGIQVMDAGEVMARNCNAKRPAVSATVKTIDVTCTGDADAVFEIQFLAGA